MPGFDYGLQLTLYTNQNDKLDMFAKMSGVYLKIENNTFAVDTTLAYDVSSGFKARVTVERIYKTYLPRPYSNCDLVDDENPPYLVNAELYNLIYHSKYNYEQQLCISI